MDPLEYRISKMLDSVHHQGLRLALGAFRKSPVESLLVEANEPSLESRREKLALNYISKVKANPENPANDVILHPNYEELYERKPKAIRPIGIRLKTAIDNAGLQLDAIREQDIRHTTLDYHTTESFTPFVKQQKVYN